MAALLLALGGAGGYKLSSWFAGDGIKSPPGSPKENFNAPGGSTGGGLSNTQIALYGALAVAVLFIAAKYKILK